MMTKEGGLVSYSDRAKNMVFIVGTDEKPAKKKVYLAACEPQRDIIFYNANCHQEIMAIYRNSPTPWEIFATKSCPKETKTQFECIKIV